MARESDVVANCAESRRGAGMSAARRQRTCAACGAPFRRGELTDLEPLIDDTVRYVAVHAGHGTYPPPPTEHGPRAADAVDRRSAAA